MVRLAHRCDPDADCDGQGFEFGGVTWGSCPHEALEDPVFQVALWYADCMEFQPVASFPDGMSMGLAHGVKSVIASRRRHSMQNQ